jgi:lipoate-protein ligase A
MNKPQIYLLRLVECPIWEQLRIEEALIRADTRNWCVLNSGSPEAIVMGISGKTDRLLDLALLQQRPIPVVRRFSGGGTVVVDRNTLFATFICQHDALPISPCYPEPIMRWTEALYRPLLPSDFQLRENDYVLGNHKFGGNAQYLRKDRWLHHSSLLWGAFHEIC